MFPLSRGTPAKEIRKRFDVDTIAKLQEQQWWDWSIAKITECLPFIMNGKIEELMRLLNHPTSFSCNFAADYREKKIRDDK